jgi:hypothetical protein
MSAWGWIWRIAATAALLVVSSLLVNFGVGVYFSLQVMTGEMPMSAIGGTDLKTTVAGIALGATSAWWFIWRKKQARAE